MSIDVTAKLNTVPDHVPPECVVDWDYNNLPGAETDYYGTWKKLQGGPTIRWTPYYGGHWIATRAHAIQEVQKDYERFSHTVFTLPRKSSPPMPPIDLDPPKHTPYRRILNIAFAPRVISGLKPEITKLAVELTEGLMNKGACEFVSDYARKFPITVFLKLVDLPLDQRDQFLEWSEASVRGTPEQKEAVYPAVLAYLRPIVEERYKNPGEDVISQILTSQVGDRRLTVEEGVGMTTLLFFGGLDTVASELSFVVNFLAGHPEHRRRLVENPEIIPKAVEELFRRHGLSNTVRLVTKDQEFFGAPLKKDELIMVPIALAGLDDQYWENAEEVDFDRDIKMMDTFGNGPHKCPGSNLARTEITVFLEEWLKRIPEFSVAKGGQVKMATGSVPCVTELPLEWPV